uniref:Uncharacterized protein n=1 Tax=Anguilla anguilla TaxID=7936 RepID=A0A0E9QBU3_ANGAN
MLVQAPKVLFVLMSGVE